MLIKKYIQTINLKGNLQISVQGETMKKLQYFYLLTIIGFSLLFHSCLKSEKQEKAQFQSATTQTVQKNDQDTTESQLAQTETKSIEKTERKYPLAPNFALQDYDGNIVKLSDYQGKVVILDFWATWCGPCRMEIPGYVKLYEKYKKHGLAIIGVSLDRGGWNPVRSFMEEYKINYPIVLGDRQIVMSYGGINSIPTTFIINRSGEVVAYKIGYRPIDFFEQTLSELL